MDPRKQATLLNYHKAIQDSVDIDKVWPDMEAIFTDQDKRSIQSQYGKEQMRMLVQLLVTKDDSAFDTFLRVLRRPYRWLSQRLRQGLKDEERRVLKAEKGIRQKITLALLTARISERQKEEITARVSHVMKDELNDRALRVSVPDHQAAAELDHVNKRLKQIINEELDPMLYGRVQETDLTKSEIDEAVQKLQTLLIELNVVQDCYDKMGVHMMGGGGKLPNLLRQKIEETQTKIKLLEKEKKELAKEKAQLTREKNEQRQELNALESENRSLEQQNRNLNLERESLEDAIRKTALLRDSVEIEKRKLEDQTVWMESMLDNLEGEKNNYDVKNKRLLDINHKLTRDIKKIALENEQLKRELQEYYGANGNKLQHENKTLNETNIKLRAEMGRLDSDRRQLMIKNQKMEYESENLKEQKRRLLIEKRKYWMENQMLRIEAKRLALGRYHSSDKLPPIKNLNRSRMSVRFSDNEDDKKSVRSHKSSRSNKSITPGRKISNGHSHNEGRSPSKGRSPSLGRSTSKSRSPSQGRANSKGRSTSKVQSPSQGRSQSKGRSYSQGRASSHDRSSSTDSRNPKGPPPSISNGSNHRRMRPEETATSYSNAASERRARERTRKNREDKIEKKPRASLYDYRKNSPRKVNQA